MAGKRILVVEDNAEHRRILVLWLQKFGEFEISEARTSQEVLDCIRRHPPDLLVLDLKLPGVNGWELARQIRALPVPLNRLPILAVTACAMAGDREKALAAGCDEYITKPIVNPGEIRDKLQRVLARSGLMEPAGIASSQTKT